MAEDKSVVVSEFVNVHSKITDRKLDGSNYLEWHKFIKLYLTSVEKDDHLTKDPPKGDKIWVRNDARLFIQIRGD